ncbi:MAG: CorA family divalent cation transporter [Clostridia bacterium]|nr:CorA family divalent cation transporter [Clostridia bacterium]MDY5555281.1 CorA family divalent cation transporter [Blautia sp.]
MTQNNVGDKQAGLFVSIMGMNEFRENKENYSHYKELLHSLGSIRYCKAEVFKNCIVGTLRIPQKNEKRIPLMTCGFYLTEKEILFIEDTGNLKQWLEKHLDKFQDIQTSDQILLQILEQMIGDDILYLSHLEKELEKMEDTLLHSIPQDFFTILTKYRQKLSELNAYYEQLTAVSDLVQSNENHPIVRNPEQWNRFSLRTERLQNHVQLLRENVLQLRELYQSRQDARQNNIMCILTVVTTLFLPLTLLTGWYGMNFANMPELNWRYGYLTVIILAVLIVIIEIIYFKKKKFF